jgi:hypothetical protein
MHEIPSATNGHFPPPVRWQHLPAQPNAHTAPNGIISPHRQPQSLQNHIFGPTIGLAYSSYSPSNTATGPEQPIISRTARPDPIQRPKPQPPEQGPTFLHYQPPGTLPYSNVTSFSSQRPPSSHSVRSSFQSPIETRPSMSPTQGNRDVGPLAGFPSSALSNGMPPSTPFERHPTHAIATSPHSSASSNQSRPLSFSSTTRTAARNSFAHTPPPPSHHSPSAAMSGLSPTKHSPVQPLSSSGVGVASVLPPVQRLQPSPKLMGRGSPDDPIPPPVKSMTPEQEDRRRRENELRQNEQQGPRYLAPAALPVQSPVQQQQQHGPPSVGIHPAHGLSGQ